MENALSLNWARGHPETRDPTRLTWTFTDWMNHFADRLADAEYRCSGGVDEPIVTGIKVDGGSCFRGIE